MTVTGKLTEYKLVKTLPADTFSVELDSLKAATCYFIVITAVNALGEGYKPKFPQSFLTAPSNHRGALYVWGSNESSALGLTEEMIGSNKEFRKVKDEVQVIEPV